MPTWNTHDFGLRKIMALEKQHITPTTRQGVGTTIAKVQPGRVAPFVEALSGVEGGVHQFGVSGFDLLFGGVEPIAQRLHARTARPG